MILGMSISRHVSLFAIQVFAFMSSCGVSDNPVLESPDGNVVVKYSGNLEDGMYYSVSYCGQDIMGDSKLGVVPVDGMVGKGASLLQLSEIPMMKFGISLGVRTKRY